MAVQYKRRPQRPDVGDLLPRALGAVLMIGRTIWDHEVTAEANRHNVGLMQAYRRIQAREYLQQRMADRRAFHSRGMCK